MREIADGVVEIDLGFVHVHLVVVDDGVVLVDTGWPGTAAKLRRALHDIRRSVGDIRTILLTHHHADHVGTAAELRRRSGARVVAHAADARTITAASPVHPSGVMRLLTPLMPRPEPVAVDEELTGDGPLSVPGFTAVHTPGHTAGHVSYLLDRAGGVLFVGDAAAGARGGRVRPTYRMLAEDVAAADASVARLARLDFDVAVFGHGRAVTGRAVDRFRELAAG